jgi:hypothetical protein
MLGPDASTTLCFAAQDVMEPDVSAAFLQADVGAHLDVTLRWREPGAAQDEGTGRTATPGESPEPGPGRPAGRPVED